MRTRGHTMLELVVTMSIIVILMGLLFPALSRAFHKALETRDDCNEHYRADNPVWTFEE